MLERRRCILVKIVDHEELCPSPPSPDVSVAHLKLCNMSLPTGCAAHVSLLLTHSRCVSLENARQFSCCFGGKTGRLDGKIVLGPHLFGQVRISGSVLQMREVCEGCFKEGRTTPPPPPLRRGIQPVSESSSHDYHHRCIGPWKTTGWCPVRGDRIGKLENLLLRTTFFPSLVFSLRRSISPLICHTGPATSDESTYVHHTYSFVAMVVACLKVGEPSSCFVVECGRCDLRRGIAGLCASRVSSHHGRCAVVVKCSERSSWECNIAQACGCFEIATT